MTVEERTTLGAPGMAGVPPAGRVATSFQPLFSVHASSLAGFQALARLVSRAGEPVAPAAYFAARTGPELVHADRECRRVHLSRFAALDEGRGLLYLNVHPEALLAGGPEDLRAELALHGLSPGRVCVEVLPGDGADAGLLAEAVGACRAAGTRVAIADSGLERRGLDRVAALAPDFVKVDLLRLDAALGSARARRVLAPLVEALQDAGAQVIVKSVEEAADALRAVEAGADLVQGYCFGVPRPSLVQDPMAMALIRRLKQLRGAGAGERGDEDAGDASERLERLLALGEDYFTISR